MDAKPFWSHKPWWCQPWSILLTGVTAIAGSWLGLHRWWFTLALGVVVLLWWVLFLVLVPASQGAASSGEEKGHDASLG